MLRGIDGDGDDDFVEEFAAARDDVEVPVSYRIE
jgi:hypothetical protein